MSDSHASGKGYASRMRVANGEVVEASGRLPVPHVHYPHQYGTFFAFSENRASQLLLCSCSREPIENYVRLRLAAPVSQNAYPARMYVLDSYDFPPALVKLLMAKGVPSDERVLDSLVYGDKLCHECNRVTPSLQYCLPMYGGVFRQKYGWYINKQAFEYGVSRFQLSVLEDACPQEVRDLLKLDPAEVRKERRRLQEVDPRQVRELERTIARQRRVVSNVIENEVRRKFGHRDIGDAWTSETILYQIIRTMCPGEPVLRHHRPPFLQGLELDVYLPERKVGIEYQGIQHFEPVDHWGGEEALTEVRLRDGKKKRLCRENDVRLVYFCYDEDLSHELVRDRIQD